MKRLAVLLPLLLALAATGHARPILTDADLIGPWHIESNLGIDELTFAADHTFTESSRGIATGTVTGQWRIEGGYLVRKATSGKLDFIGQKVDGVNRREKIILFKGKTLLTQIPGQNISYRRGPFNPNFNPGPLNTAADVARASADSTEVLVNKLPLADYPALARFHDLEQARFWIAGEAGADDARLIAFAKIGFPRLKTVDLLSCAKVTDAGILEIARLPALDFVHLAGTSVGDAGCEALAARGTLTAINIEMCPRVTVKGVLALARSAVLKDLLFSASHLSPAQVLAIIAARPRGTECGVHDPDGKLDERALVKAGKARGVKVSTYVKCGLQTLMEPD